MLSDVGRGDVVVAVVFAGQDQSTIRVDLDDAEAFSVGHPQVGVVGSGQHTVAGEEVQAVASGGGVVVGVEVAGVDALGLDVRVEGGGLGIGAHGARHTAASCNI